MRNSSLFHAVSWVFMKRFRIFKKITIFSVQMRESILFMRFHNISWKNIELFKKITLFLVQIIDSSLFHAHLWVFMKKYWIFKDIQRYFDFQSSHFTKFRCEIQVSLLFPVQMWDSSLLHNSWSGDISYWQNVYLLTVVPCLPIQLQNLNI